MKKAKRKEKKNCYLQFNTDHKQISYKHLMLPLEHVTLKYIDHLNFKFHYFTFWKTFARFCSDSPKYFPNTVDRLTGMTFRWNSVAMAMTNEVLPHPGGPNKKNLDGGEIPQSWKMAL